MAAISTNSKIKFQTGSGSVLPGAYAVGFINRHAVDNATIYDSDNVALIIPPGEVINLPTPPQTFGEIVFVGNASFQVISIY